MGIRKKSVKKVAEIWITPETLEKVFPKNSVVTCKVVDMKTNDNNKILLRPCQNSRLKYEVFAKSKKEYYNFKTLLKSKKYF